jgi:hypothetical protein
MQRYNDYVIDQYGNPVASATITVFETGTSTPATLYADNSLTTLTNPTLSDGLGKFYFYAADGRYDIQISGTNFPTQTITDVLLEDPLDGSAAKFSSVTITPLTGILAGNGASPVGLAATGTADQILPSQTGQAGKVLLTDGTTASWSATGAGLGTVTSIDFSGGTTGLTTSGGPVDTSGTITLAGTLTEANGGTGETIYSPGQILVGNAAGGLSRATIASGTNITVTSGDGSVSVALSGTVAEANGGTGETTYTDGQLLIGNTAGGLTKSTLTAGAGIGITNGDGSVTIAYTGDSGTGDVVGPASSVDGEVALFDGITGKLVKSATLTGALTATAGVLATDATLTSLSALGTAADKYAYTTGVDTWAEGAITAAGRAILDDTDASAQRTTLGLVIGTNVQAYDADTAKTDVAQTFTASQRGTVTTDNDGSFDQAVTNNFKCTPSGAAALTFTNHAAGQSGLVIFINGSNYAITAAATTYIAAADLTKLSATGTYLIAYLDDGTNAYCTVTAALTSAGV